MDFKTTALCVLMMMAYAVPGYLLVKGKLLSGNDIPGLAKILLYVCQPCLQLYSFNKATYTPELFKNMLIVFALCILLQIIMLFSVYVLFRKKYDNPAYRVCTIATTFGNVGFLGVPLLEALLPNYPDAIAFSAIFIVAMNILSWTLGSYMLTGKKEYISFKKLILNPPVLTLFVALPLFFMNIKLPAMIGNSVSLVGKMTTPICMIILGMRLATVKPALLFNNVKPYIVAVLKLAIFPLLGFLLFYFIPIPSEIKATIFILCCCPTASVVLNLSEIYGSGQDTAANMVLTSTIFSMLSIPLMLLML